MEIIAKRGYGGLYYTPACLSSPSLNKKAFIRFAIDTGATITSVSSIDAVLNGIDCSKLQPLSPTFSATTPNIRTCFISDCKLIFIYEDIVMDCYFVMYFMAKFGTILDYIILCLMAQSL